MSIQFGGHVQLPAPSRAHNCDLRRSCPSLLLAVCFELHEKRHPVNAPLVKFGVGKVWAANLSIANIFSFGTQYIPIIFHLFWIHSFHFAIVSPSRNSVEAIFLTHKNPTITGRPIPSVSCKISPEDQHCLYLP